MNPLAIDALTNHQRQLDIDGVEVGVSRQALDELLAAYQILLSANEFLRNARDAMEKNWLEAARQRSSLNDSLSEAKGEIEWLSRELERCRSHPACDHEWVIWPETDGQEQKCMKCGAYRKSPK